MSKAARAWGHEGEAERLALLVRKHRDQFSLRHRSLAESILFWLRFDPRALRRRISCEALESMHDEAERLELLG